MKYEPGYTSRTRWGVYIEGTETLIEGEFATFEEAERYCRFLEAQQN